MVEYGLLSFMVVADVRGMQLIYLVIKLDLRQITVDLSVLLKNKGADLHP